MSGIKDIHTMELSSFFNGELIKYLKDNSYDYERILSKKSKKILVFKKDDFKCKSCGMVCNSVKIQNDAAGNVFIRFYHNDVLFTIDHIIPRKAGGSSNIENLQTMYSPCNHKKDCKVEGLSIASAKVTREKLMIMGVFPQTIGMFNSSVISYRLDGIKHADVVYWWAAAFYQDDMEIFCDRSMNYARKMVENLIRKKHNIKAY